MRLLNVGRLRDRRWREVLLNTASLLYEADDFFLRFQSTLDTDVREDAELLALLHWADTKALPFKDMYNSNALRAFYVYLILDLSFTRSRTRTDTRALALALDCARDLVRALDRTLNRALDSNRAHTRTLDLTLDRDLAHALDRARTRASAHTSFPLGLVLDICVVDAFYFAVVSDITHEFEDSTQHLPLFASYLRDIAALAQRTHIPALAEALSYLRVPLPYAPQADWDSFVNAMKALLAHCNLYHDFVLSDAQIGKIADYFAATQLLVDCLNLARVSDREGIEARILQPPEE